MPLQGVQLEQAGSRQQLWGTEHLGHVGPGLWPRHHRTARCCSRPTSGARPHQRDTRRALVYVCSKPAEYLLGHPVVQDGQMLAGISDLGSLQR